MKIFNHYYGENRLVKADFCEKVGDFLTRPIKVLLGGDYKIDGRFISETTNYSSLQKIICIAFLFIFSKLMIPVTLVGLALTSMSASHQFYRTAQQDQSKRISSLF